MISMKSLSFLASLAALAQAQPKLSDIEIFVFFRRHPVEIPPRLECDGVHGGAPLAVKLTLATK